MSLDDGGPFVLLLLDEPMEKIFSSFLRFLALFRMLGTVSYLLRLSESREDALSSSSIELRLVFAIESSPPPLSMRLEMNAEVWFLLLFSLLKLVLAAMLDVFLLAELRLGMVGFDGIIPTFK